jgi:hypothetical protein
MAKTIHTPWGSLSAAEFFSRNLTPIAWTCAGFFTLANVLLSYFPLTITQALWTILAGFLLPLVSLLFIPAKNIALDSKKDVFAKIPLGLWATVAVLALFLRLLRLDSLSSWPTVDEGVFGYFATQLSLKWNWRLLENTSQLPALYSWGQGLLFKCWGPSLFSLWLYPALWSLACLPAAVWSARKIFPRSSVFFLFCFIGSGFWALYLGRLSIQGGFLLFWELLALGLLISVIQNPKERNSKNLILLTLVTGLGFYTYLAWPLVALFIGITLCLLFPGSLKDKIKNLFLLALGAFLFLAPWMLALHREYRGYLDHIWAKPQEESLFSRLPLAFSYFRNLFWGLPSPLSMGGVWGGLFNPLVTSLFFLGMIYFFRTKIASLKFLGFIALALFFSPAFLTTDLEMTRLVSLIPFVLGFAALGLQWLVDQTPKASRLPFAAAVLFASLGLDLTHFLVVYPVHWEKNINYYGAHKTIEYARAYPFLKKQANVKGPGIILLNFVPDPYDQTLSTAVAGFNNAWNPNLTPSPTWAAILVNIHSAPALSAKFPQSQWFWLSQGLNRPDGGLLLGIMPITPGVQGLIKKWASADQALDPLVDQVLERGVDPDQNAMLQILKNAAPFFQGDPLLESYRLRLCAIHEAAAGQYAGSIADETRALQKAGRQAALFNERGCLRVKTGDISGARRDFNLAIQSRPDYTDALENLRALSPSKK